MLVLLVFFFFFFKQKTAYEMRISDWSSDVCSSDLLRALRRLVLDVVRLVDDHPAEAVGAEPAEVAVEDLVVDDEHVGPAVDIEIGRASCRERVCQYV